MYSFDDIRYVSLPLPEDVCKAKWSGHFEEAKKLIRGKLADTRLPEALRARLRVEEGILEEMPREYPYTREQALKKMREGIDDFTYADLDKAEADGMVDVLYIEGEKHYLRSFAATLYNSVPAISDRAGKERGSSAPLLNDMIRQVREEGIVRRTLRLKATLRVDEDAFIKGETYRVHLPIPAKAPQVENIRLIAFSHTPKVVGNEDDPQRCVCFEETLAENAEFSAEYEYDIVVRRNMRYDAGIVTEDDLSEHAPHILFTPYMRALAAELSEGRVTDMEKAKAFYDFITTRTTYSFVRDYFLIDDAGEYVAKNRKGDCGLQALCFITLCRIAGIPARWQSGMSARPGDCGSHDWAMFYTKEGGWRLCDPSFGGSGFRAGDEVRRNFYFGNLEPYRMIANSQYYAPLSGEKRFPRNDPYDNQCGECEDTTHALSGREFTISRKVLDVR